MPHLVVYTFCTLIYFMIVTISAQGQLLRTPFYAVIKAATYWLQIAHCFKKLNLKERNTVILNLYSIMMDLEWMTMWLNVYFLLKVSLRVTCSPFLCSVLSYTLIQEGNDKSSYFFFYFCLKLKLRVSWTSKSSEPCALYHHVVLHQSNC